MTLPPNEPLPRVVGEHFSEASFLWEMRCRMARSPVDTLAQLERWDRRLEAHVDGLRLAGEAGWARVEEELEILAAREAFTSAVVALELGSRAHLSQVLEQVGDSELHHKAVISALGWTAEHRVAGVLEQLARSEEPAVCRIGIAGYAIHRRDPGLALRRALASEDTRLQARALRAVGELGRGEWLPLVRPHLAAEEEGCRFAAAWSSALLGESAAVPVLCALAEARGAWAEAACDMAVRSMQMSTAQRWLSRLDQQPQLRRLAIVGSAALGSPARVPWLVEMMQVPHLARVAGEAFSSITGAELSEHLLASGPPEDSPDDADEELPFPEPRAVEAWWAQRHQDFHPEARYLQGRPMSLEGLRGVLQQGRQRERRAAAVELALRRPGQPLFETRAPASRQRRWLVTLG
jgi:uncharacterized protein (TIGR02270 family)